MKPRENTAVPSGAFQLPQNYKTMFQPNFQLSPQLMETILQANVEKAEAAQKKKRNIIIGSVVGVLLLGGGIALAVKSKK